MCVGLSVTYYVTKLTCIYISAENQDIDPKLSESVDWNILRWSMISNICLLQVMSPKLPMMKWFSQLISYPAKKQKNIDYISQEPSSKSPMITEWFSIRRLNIGMASNMLLLHFEQWWRYLNTLWQQMLRKIYKHIAWGNGTLHSPRSIYWSWHALLNAKCNIITWLGSRLCKVCNIVLFQKTDGLSKENILSYCAMSCHVMSLYDMPFQVISYLRSMFWLTPLE